MECSRCVGRRCRKPRRPDAASVEFIGGPEKLELGLCSHDAKWAVTYRDHRRRISDALGGEYFEIEHIGSTSVPGLAAKPIVDIVVAVEDITAEEDYLTALLAAGYDDPAIGEYLLLRNHLRRNVDDRVLYERTKRTLIEKQWDDMNDYADAKTEVILAIKARARAACMR